LSSELPPSAQNTLSFAASRRQLGQLDRADAVAAMSFVLMPSCFICAQHRAGLRVHAAVENDVGLLVADRGQNGLKSVALSLVN